MNRTKIEWVKNPDGTQGYTWNPITGCLNGCEYCYARKLANRRLKQRYLANQNLTPCGHGSQNSICIIPDDLTDPFYPRFWPDRLKDPYIDTSRKQHTKGIFVCDMGEMFGDWIPREWQSKVFQVIRDNPWHRFYLLTKQSHNLIKWSPFPDNCWIGVTATNQIMFLNACSWFERIKTKMSFISIEPLLSWGDSEHTGVKHSTASWLKEANINWLIIGGMSGSKPFYPSEEWIQEIEQAADKAGIPVFEKYNLRKTWAKAPKQQFPEMPKLTATNNSSNLEEVKL